MFEKEAKERARDFTDNKERQAAYECGFLDGVDRMRGEIKHELMLKLKDEGIVKPLKDSIISNKKLSSQEQQELCAWLECAMEFGEMLDECAKELEAGRPQWHFVKDGDLPKNENDVLVYSGEDWRMCVGRYSPKYKAWEAGCDAIAWCEIPKYTEE